MTMLKDSWDGRFLKVGGVAMASFVLAALLSLAGARAPAGTAVAAKAPAVTAPVAGG